VASRPLIAIVDDDESVRESLPDLLGELGYDARAFPSAREFLHSDALVHARCLLLDVAMPGVSGPELLRELRARGHTVPVIFITAQADTNVRADLLSQGAIDCLFKPFGEQDLKAALQSALGAS
jgi:FixJ family two-component response regulator